MPDANPSTILCTSCGLCCTGALHRAALLYPDEIDAARAKGLEVISTDPGEFALPCPKLIGTCCSIFATRPRVCGGYKCQLLLNLEAGEVGLNEALETVETALGLTAKASESLADAAEETVRLQSRLHRTALALYLDKYFMNSTDRKILEMTIVGSPNLNPETQ